MILTSKYKRFMRFFYIFAFIMIEIVSYKTTNEFMKRPDNYDRQCLIMNKSYDPTFVKDSEGNQTLVKFKFICKDARSEVYVKYINEADFYKSKAGDIVYIKFKKVYDDVLSFWGPLTSFLTFCSILILTGFIICSVIKNIVGVFSDD